MKLVDQNQEVKSKLAILEYHLIVHFRPTFLVITNPHEDDGHVEIIISCISFKLQSVQERIHNIFMVINKVVPDLIASINIVVQAYSGDEMEDILGTLFDDKIELL